MTLAKFVAEIGESPAFVAFNAHCWFAFSVVTVVSSEIPSIWIIPICISLAGIKEFWFDLRYETTPVQTFKDSLLDFQGYLTGIFLAIIWIL